MVKPLAIGLLLVACGWARAEPAASLELKVTAWRDRYVVSPPAGGRAATGYVPAIALEAELRNAGTVPFQISGPPEPELAVTGSKVDSVRKTGGHFFYAPQTVAFTLDPGEVKRLPLRSLRYRVGTEQWMLRWQEPGEYKLTATWVLAATPVVAGAAPNAAQPVAINVAAGPVLLRVRAGDEVAYWAEALSDAADEVRLTAALALKERERSAAGALKQLAAALADRNPTVRRVAAEVLQQLGTAAETESPALRQALSDREPTVRAAAAAALAQVAAKDPRSARAVVPLLQDRSDAVRQAGAQALGYMACGGLPPDLETVAALRAALKDADPSTRAKAIWALGYVRHPDSVLDLIGLLKPEHRALRHQVLQTLGNLGALAAPAVPELIGMLRSDPEHREMAAWALGCIGPKAAAAVPTLIACLGDERAAVRNQAARTLRDIGPGAAEAVSALADVTLADKDWGVRQYAAQALGAIGPGAARATRQLGQALGDPMVQVRAAAAQALGSVGPKANEALPSLLAMLRLDPDSQARCLAAQSVGQIGVADESTVGALVKALADRESSVASASAIALGQLGPAAVAAAPALTRLAGAAEIDPTVRQFARQALERVGRK